MNEMRKLAWVLIIVSGVFLCSWFVAIWHIVSVVHGLESTALSLKNVIEEGRSLEPTTDSINKVVEVGQNICVWFLTNLRSLSRGFFVWNLLMASILGWNMMVGVSILKRSRKIQDVKTSSVS